jgi:hypothetical protein
MTDPFTTLRLPSRPLPIGGEALAISTGRGRLRRRRIATAVVSGGSALAVAAAVAFVTGGAGQGDALSTVTPAGGGAGGSASATPAPTIPAGVVPSPLPAPTGLPVGIGPGSSASPSPAPTPTSTETTAPPQGPYVGFEPTAPDGGPAVTRTMSNDPAFCEKNAQVAEYRHPDGWCSTLTTSAPSGFVAGHRISLTFTMCKAPESGAMTLHFANRMEVDLAANETAADGAETTRWTWDGGFDFPAAAHTLTFNAGDCATWVMTWSGQANDGYAVPEGDYDMVAGLTATEYTSDDADHAPPIAYLLSGERVSWS